MVTTLVKLFPKIIILCVNERFNGKYILTTFFTEKFLERFKIILPGSFSSFNSEGFFWGFFFTLLQASLVASMGWVACPETLQFPLPFLNDAMKTRKKSQSTPSKFSDVQVSFCPFLRETFYYTTSEMLCNAFPNFGENAKVSWGFLDLFWEKKSKIINIFCKIEFPFLNQLCFWLPDLYPDLFFIMVLYCSGTKGFFSASSVE